MNATFKLSKPIPYAGDKTIEVVTYRRPKVRDLRELNRAAKSDNEMDQAVAMVVACTDLTEDMVNEIDAEDFSGLAEGCVGFMPAPKETSET